MPLLATLRDLHRAHRLAIPYENLDIHLGVPLTLDPERIFAKLVDERRGGWCYEMNGLFDWSSSRWASTCAASRVASAAPRAGGGRKATTSC